MYIVLIFLVTIIKHMARIEPGTGKLIESVGDTSVSPIKAGTIIERNKPKVVSIDQFTKLINSNLDELGDVVKQSGGDSINATKISDIVAKYLGFDKSPRKNNTCRVR